MSIGKVSARVAEILVVLPILLIVSAPVFRIVYGQREREWERQVLERLDIDPQLAWLACAVIAVSFLILRLRRRLKRDA